jgi:hypothetical protein
MNNDVRHIKIHCNNEIRRFFINKMSDFAELERTTRDIFSFAPETPITFKYLDDENEWVTISCDLDLLTANEICPDLLRMSLHFPQVTPVVEEIQAGKVEDDGEHEWRHKWKGTRCGGRGRGGRRGRCGGKHGKRGKKWRKQEDESDSSESIDATMNLEQIKAELALVKNEKEVIISKIKDDFKPKVWAKKTELRDAREKGETEKVVNLRTELRAIKSEKWELIKQKKSCWRKIRQLNELAKTKSE